MDAVVVFGNYGKFALAADLQIHLRMDRTGIFVFIYRRAQIINIVLGILFGLDRHLVTREDTNRIGVAADQRKSAQFQFKLMVIANIYDDIALKLAGDLIHRVLRNGSKGDGSAIYFVSVFRSRNPLQCHTLRNLIKQAVIDAGIIHFFSETDIIAAQSGRSALRIGHIIMIGVGFPVCSAACQQKQAQQQRR